MNHDGNIRLCDVQISHILYNVMETGYVEKQRMQLSHWLLDYIMDILKETLTFSLNIFFFMYINEAFTVS